MRHIRVITLALVLALLLALAAGLAACGSTDDGGIDDAEAAGTTTYRSDEYRFSITYPARYVTIDDPSNDGTSTTDFDIAWADPDGKVIDDSYVDGIQVIVVEMDGKLTPKQVKKLKPVYQEVVDQIIASSEGGEVKDKLGPVELNGTPGFGFSYFFTQDGTKVRASAFFLIKGKYQYTVNAQATADRWDEIAPELEAAAMSFMID